ncbi:Ig-like domain-containing protein [Vibrio anguillarum]|uniref:Ig-like domain-containing protein n=2 Tax=Vibrio anguillarum TaxID=55601 RepID=UPI00097E33E3|nr:Ig-like domain-containing protein [Vibrio anguillarum]
MTKFFKGLFALIVLPLLMLLTGCNSDDVSSEPTVKLERIDITASPLTTRGVSQLTLAVGDKQPFDVVGHYSDGSSRILTDSNAVDWHASDLDVVLFDAPGIITGNTPGVVTVHASSGNIASNDVMVNVSSAEITEITVTPSPVQVAQGQTQQLTAMATYSDGTSSDVTNSVTWTPTDTVTATVTTEGLLSGVEENSTTLTATKAGVTSNEVTVNVSSAEITEITVTPSQVNIAKGQTQQLTAIATYSDGTSSSVTNSVMWTPADANTATVTSTGLITGVGVGSTTMAVTKDGITSNTVNVTVSSAVITAIQVTPSQVNVAKGQTQQLTAIATYSDTTSSDISSSVTWTPADTNTITVTSTGLITGVEVGSTTVTATKNGISNSVNVTVSSAVITAIQVTPTTVNVAKGLNGQLTATATYSDGTSSSVTKSVTWMSVDTNTATVTLDGLLTGVEVGSTTVTATKDGIASNQVNVNVCADLAGVCIDIFDIGSGTLFTNSPSVAYLNSIGGSTIANDVTTETGIDGPIGDFYRFKWDNANALCEIYNAQNLGGRTNWRLAESDELLNELYVGFGNMFNARSWPTDYWYWSKTTDLSNPVNHDTLLLSDGIPVSASPTAILYVSCVSNP